MASSCYCVQIQSGHQSYSKLSNLNALLAKLYVYITEIRISSDHDNHIQPAGRAVDLNDLKKEGTIFFLSNSASRIYMIYKKKEKKSDLQGIVQTLFFYSRN